jgi:hypothetical protein
MGIFCRWRVSGPCGKVIGMASEFEVCSGCDERHALRPDGNGMAIHNIANGVRCPGPKTVARPQRTVRAPKPKGKPKLNSELQAAFDAAPERRWKPASDAPSDRRIYVTTPQHQVRGGLPTLGRRR